jgi:hypothetical protein
MQDIGDLGVVDVGIRVLKRVSGWFAVHALRNVPIRRNIFSRHFPEFHGCNIFDDLVHSESVKGEGCFSTTRYFRV